LLTSNFITLVKFSYACTSLIFLFVLLFFLGFVVCHISLSLLEMLYVASNPSANLWFEGGGGDRKNGNVNTLQSLQVVHIYVKKIRF